MLKNEKEYIAYREAHEKFMREPGFVFNENPGTFFDQTTDVLMTFEGLRRLAEAIPMDVAKQMSYDMDMTRKMFKVKPGGKTDAQLREMVESLDAYVTALERLPLWLR